MISKAEAQAAVDSYISTLRDRVNLFLQARARQGFVGGTFTYTAQDTGPKAQAVRTELLNLGWTVVVDTTTRTVTIS